MMRGIAYSPVAGSRAHSISRVRVVFMAEFQPMFAMNRNSVSMRYGSPATAFAITFFATGTPLVAFVPAVAAATLPRAYFGRRRAARLRELQAAWPDGLRDLGASLAAGRSLGHSLITLAETGPQPLREAFARFPALSRMLGPVAALEVVKAELADPTSDRVIEVLILVPLAWVLAMVVVGLAHPDAQIWQQGGWAGYLAIALAVVGVFTAAALGFVAVGERRWIGGWAVAGISLPWLIGALGAVYGFQMVTAAIGAASPDYVRLIGAVGFGESMAPRIIA